MGLTDVIFNLTDIKINLAEVLLRRVQNLLGPRTSANSRSAEGGASLASSLVVFMSMFYMAFQLALHCIRAINAKATGSSLVATKK